MPRSAGAWRPAGASGRCSSASGTAWEAEVEQHEVEPLGIAGVVQRFAQSAYGTDAGFAEGAPGELPKRLRHYRIVVYEEDVHARHCGDRVAAAAIGREYARTQQQRPQKSYRVSSQPTKPSSVAPAARVSGTKASCAILKHRSWRLEARDNEPMAKVWLAVGLCVLAWRAAAVSKHHENRGGPSGA